MSFVAETNWHKLLFIQTSARQYLLDHLRSVFECELPEGGIEVEDVLKLLQDRQTHKQGEVGMTKINFDNKNMLIGTVWTGSTLICIKLSVAFFLC